MDRRKEWLEKAEALSPRIFRETVRPISGLPDEAIAEADSAVLDFGNHFVGHLALKLSYAGSHPDAPAWLELKFCENRRELGETLEGYNGWISKGWIQTERIHVDVLPATISLPRRYAFRYVKIDVLALSQKYRLTIEDAWADTETSAVTGRFPPFQAKMWTPP